MTIENSPRAISAAPARKRPGRPIPARLAAQMPGDHLGGGGDDGQQQGPAEHGRDGGRVGVEAEDHEEDRREKVPQRLQDPGGAVRGGPRNSDAEHKGAHRRGYLHGRGQPGHQQRRPEQVEQEHLGVFAVHGLGHMVPVPQRHQQHDCDHGERDPDGLQPHEEADAGQGRGQDRQVDGHGQILEHQDRENHRGFAVADPAQVRDHLRRDSRRRNIGDPAHHHRPHHSPAQQDREEGPRQEVQDEVQDTRLPRAAEPRNQFGGRIFQSEHKQEEDDTDLAREMCELLHAFELHDPAGTEEQAAEEIQRDGGHADPPGQPRQHAEAKDDGPEFNQGQCERIHAVSRCAGCRPPCPGLLAFLLQRGDRPGAGRGRVPVRGPPRPRA